MMKNILNKGRGSLLFLFLILSLYLGGCTSLSVSQQVEKPVDSELTYSGSPYEELNGNQPEFTEREKKNRKSFEKYSELDDLGRCGVAYANISEEIMPTEERGSIGQVKPTGWHTVKYDVVDGKYLYNRCHLIGYQLAGENANEKNLITGTRYMNVEGMLPFENKVADYVEDTGNHVLYRVTPIYEGKDLVAKAVQMEGYSVEDQGKGICFNVLVYNAQPGVTIDYATGDSRLSGEADAGAEADDGPESDTSAGSGGKSSSLTSQSGQKYVLNTNTGKFHKPSCSSVADTKIQNRKKYAGNREELLEQGYEPCSRCKP